MPQLAGGGSTGRVRPSRVTAQRAGAYDAQTPDPQDIARMKEAQALEDKDYSALDFVKQVGGFPGKLYDEADQSLRGLIGMIGNLDEQTPMDAGFDPGLMARGAIENWSHPVDYANEHPLGFMGDVALAGSLGAGALESAATRYGSSVPEWLSSETGAIGPFGKAMEEAASRGERASGVRNTTLLGNGEVGIVPSAYPVQGLNGLEGYTPKSSISGPNYGIADVGTGESMMTGPSVLKPDDWTNQIAGELGTQEMNRLVGSPVRMPGSMRGNFDYAKISAHETPEGVPWSDYDPAKVDQTNGLVVEALPFEKATPGEFVTNQHSQSLQDILMQDFVTGNTDRTLAGHNLGSLEGEPLPFDMGLGFRRTNPDFTMKEWTGLQPTPAQWPGYELNDAHKARLAQYQSVLEDAAGAQFMPGEYNVMAAELPPEQILAAIDRARAALGRDTLFAPDPLGPGPMNGFNIPGSPSNTQAVWPTGSPIHSSEIFNAPIPNTPLPTLMERLEALRAQIRALEERQQ